MNSPTEPTQGEITEILQELCNTVYRHGQALRTNTPFHYGEPMKEATELLLSLLKRQDRYARLDELDRTFSDGYASFRSPEDGEIYDYQHSANFYKLRRQELKSKNGE